MHICSRCLLPMLAELVYTLPAYFPRVHPASLSPLPNTQTSTYAYTRSRAGGMHACAYTDWLASRRMTKDHRASNRRAVGLLSVIPRLLSALIYTRRAIYISYIGSRIDASSTRTTTTTTTVFPLRALSGFS